MAKKPAVVFLVGPTAIGKTAAAIQLAKALKTEIVSADSRQFYREMPIGTAHPSAVERAEIPHHFVDFLPVTAEFSAGSYERAVLNFLSDYFEKNTSIVVTGGSGLYVNALANGFDALPHDPAVRQKLNETLEEKGLAYLQSRLLALDPEHYEAMDIHNPQRLIRALEVCMVSGLKYSALRQDAPSDRPFDAIWVGLTASRDVMYDRINTRVDAMIDAGLEAEVRSLLPHRGLNALNTVGYKEWFDHFDGKLTRDEAIDKIKQHTRNFAKRQMTWFGRNEAITWFDREQVKEMIAHTIEQIRER